MFHSFEKFFKRFFSEEKFVVFVLSFWGNDVGVRSVDDPFLPTARDFLKSSENVFASWQMFDNFRANNNIKELTLIRKFYALGKSKDAVPPIRFEECFRKEGYVAGVFSTDENWLARATTNREDVFRVGAELLEDLIARLFPISFMNTIKSVYIVFRAGQQFRTYRDHVF